MTFARNYSAAPSNGNNYSFPFRCHKFNILSFIIISCCALSHGIKASLTTLNSALTSKECAYKNLFARFFFRKEKGAISIFAAGDSLLSDAGGATIGRPALKFFMDDNILCQSNGNVI